VQGVRSRQVPGPRFVDDYCVQDVQQGNICFISDSDVVRFVRIWKVPRPNCVIDYCVQNVWRGSGCSQDRKFML
jgi:hypothetical protein